VRPDPAETAYNEGRRLWEARRYDEARQLLEVAASRYAGSRWASGIRYLLGRVHLDDNRPALASTALYENYRDLPRGEWAADSLFYLGTSLTRLNRRTDACRVLNELADVFPNMRASVRSQLPSARAGAGCG
jgi:TolA-binding protein